MTQTVKLAAGLIEILYDKQTVNNKTFEAGEEDIIRLIHHVTERTREECWYKVRDRLKELGIGPYTRELIKMSIKTARWEDEAIS